MVYLSEREAAVVNDEDNYYDNSNRKFHTILELLVEKKHVKGLPHKLLV